MKKIGLKVICGVVLSVMVCMVCILKIHNEPKKLINCYTISSKEETSLPQAQEDRQYLIDSYENLKQFEKDFNVDLSKYVTNKTFKDNLVLILVSSEPDGNVSCKLGSLYVDENNEPHMLIDKKDSNEANTSWYFVATVGRDYSKELNYTRWNIY